MRLRELEEEGFIKCVEKKRQQPLMVVWRLTEKGRDTLPILMQLTAFGFKWHADVVFEDKRPRNLHEIFSQPEAIKMIIGIE